MSFGITSLFWNNKLSLIKIRCVCGEKYGGKLPILWNVANVGEVALRKYAGKRNALDNFDLKKNIATMKQ